VVENVEIKPFVAEKLIVESVEKATLLAENELTTIDDARRKGAVIVFVTIEEKNPRFAVNAFWCVPPVIYQRDVLPAYT
jgi:hypothetical protein